MTHAQARDDSRTTHRRCAWDVKISNTERCLCIPPGCPGLTRLLSRPPGFTSGGRSTPASAGVNRAHPLRSCFCVAPHRPSGSESDPSPFGKDGSLSLVPKLPRLLSRRTFYLLALESPVTPPATPPSTVPVHPHPRRYFVCSERETHPTPGTSSCPRHTTLVTSSLPEDLLLLGPFPSPARFQDSVVLQTGSLPSDFLRATDLVSRILPLTRPCKKPRRKLSQESSFTETQPLRLHRPPQSL